MSSMICADSRAAIFASVLAQGARKGQQDVIFHPCERIAAAIRLPSQS